MKKTHADRRVSHKLWKMRIEENIKEMYKYNYSCTAFLEKYDIAERKFM